MSTAQQVIDRARRSLLSGHREELNQLAVALTDTIGTSVAFSNTLRGIAEGADFEVDGELMHVWAIDASSKTATVTRGWQGSTAATHAVNAVARINPRFPTVDMMAALVDEVNDLCSPVNGLFRMRTAAVTWKVGVDFEGYDISAITDMLTPYALDGDTRGWYEVDRTNSVLRADFTLTTVTLMYRATYSAPASLSTDLVATSGVPSTLEDVLVWGVQSRLVPQRETSRNFIDSQGEPRRAEEVPPGAASQSFGGLYRMRTQRIMAEAMRLKAQYPIRSRRA